MKLFEFDQQKKASVLIMLTTTIKRKKKKNGSYGKCKKVKLRHSHIIKISKIFF